MGLGNEEHNEVLVEIVEVPSIHLVEVVGELGLSVPLGGDAPVEVHHTKGITVEDDAEDAGDFLLMTGSGSNVDFTGIREGIVGAGPLPEWNGLCIHELGILVMERAGLKEYISGRSELRQHNDMLEIFGGEALLASNVEQGRHSGKPVNVEGHIVRRIPNKIGIEDSLRGGEILCVLSIKSRKQVDSFGAACGGNGGTVVLIEHGFADHVVDGTHDKGVGAHSHGLLDLVVKHRDKSIELGCGGERLLHLHLGDGPVDLESGHFVEELSFRVGLMENVRIVGGSIGQVPRLIFYRLGHFAGDFFDDRTILPRVHEDGRSGAAIGTIDKDHFADVVDQRFDIFVKSLGVEDGRTNVNDIGKILGQDSAVADGLTGGVIYKLVNLRYFHFLIFSFLF